MGKKNLPSAPSRPSHAPDVDYSGKHPFDVRGRRRRRRRRHLDRGGGRHHDDDDIAATTTDVESDPNYMPLRLKFDVSDLLIELENAISANDGAMATKLYLLIYEILPMTSRGWGDVLRVIPVTGGIYPLAARGGTGDDQLIPTDGGVDGDGNNNDGGGGGGGGGGGDTPYDDPVRNMYCPDETTSGIGGGADLLVYATIDRHCATSSDDGSGGGRAGAGGVYRHPRVGIDLPARSVRSSHHR